ncbi:beta strand repeat-containing protein [Verrucomicrobium spinosum]|uniref:beta strand repeat-containing protein n=2 Tax=Verrucomicrobium spinosum TaxID=2736 RepID=UPI0001744963|nr:autotransporter-associated beta strand repeat-containing protein [Verrucomicrobium spinosum]
MLTTTRFFAASRCLILASVGVMSSLPGFGQYFDSSSASGLTPAPTAVNWQSNVWQSFDSPGTTPPGAWADGGDAYFQTGGTNLVNITNEVNVRDLTQSVTGTSTILGGNGTLTLTGAAVINGSGSNLQFLSGLSLLIQPTGLSFEFRASSSDILIDAVLKGGSALEKTGSGTLYLNRANVLTGNITLSGGVTEIGSAAALGTGRLIINGATLRYGRGVADDVSDQLDPIGAGGAVINTNGGLINFSSALSGSGTLTKQGTGILVLNAASPSYTGQIVVNEGTLAINPATTGTTATILGTSGSTAVNGVLVKNGATLDLSGGGTANEPFNEYIALEGRGVNGQGALIKNGGQNQSAMNVYLTGHTTIFNNSRIDMDNVFDAAGFSLTKLGTGELPLEGGNTRNLGNVFVKQGTLNFSGGADMGYDASATFGNTIFINTGAVLQTYDKGSDLKRITLNGGTLRRGGGSTNVNVTTIGITGGITLNAGASSIARNSTVHGLIWGLNVINRSVGATVDHDVLVVGPTTYKTLATTDTRNTNGILGGYFTYGGTTWAVNGPDTDDGAIGGLVDASFQTSSDSSTWLATENVSLAGDPAASISTRTIHSLRLTALANLTIGAGESLTLGSGGVLVTGAGATSIAGGFLQSGNSQDLVVIQNASQALTISSTIRNNGGATALTKSGTGTLILSGTNTYSGGTYINGGNNSGTIGTGVVQVTNVTASGNDNLGDNSATNDLYFNNGTLRYSNTSANGTISRDVNLLSGGGVLEVVTAGVTVEISGKISGEALAADEGFFSSQGTLTKTGAGTLVISNGNNDYTGGNIVNGGILRLSGAGKLGASIGYLTVGAAGVVDLNGTSQSVGLLSGSAGAIIRNNGAGSQNLTFGNGNASSVTNLTSASSTGYAGIIQDNDGTGSGAVSLTKVGTGTQILSGVNTYTGTTSINEGTLQMGAGTGSATSTARSGSGAVTVAASATLSGNGIIGGNTSIAANGLLSVGVFGQTVAQTLTFAGSLVNDGVISLDVWSASGIDQIKFTGSGTVDLNGRLIVNNNAVSSNLWTANQSLKLFDWGTMSVLDRSIADMLLDIGAMKLSDSANTYWDTSRLLVDGTIVVLANALVWDANTGTNGAQDGAGNWAVTPNTNWWTGSANTSFVSDGTLNVIFGSGSGAAGAVSVQAGGVLVNNITFNDAGSSNYTIQGGNVTLTAGAWIATNHAYSDTAGTTITAILAGTNWTKSGQGRLILNANNAFTGTVTVAQGVLDVRHANALGPNASSTTTVMSGATLEIRGGITVNENLVINGSGHQSGGVSLGAISNQSGSNTFSGTISVATNSQITAQAGTVSLSGVISGSAGLVITAVDPAAIVQFTGNGSNTYTGATSVNSGILRLAKTQFLNSITTNTQVNIGDGVGSSRDILRLGTSDQIHDTGTVLSFKGSGAGGGVFQLFGFNETVGTIRSTNGDGVIENGGSGVSTLTVNNVTNDVFSGILQNGAAGTLAFTKINNGILSLTGANTYTGATSVRAGVLELSGGGTLSGTTAIQVASGGTLRLTNTSGANSANRLNDSAAISMVGGKLEFSHNGGSASYSETAGALNLESGANSISSSQAAGGFTSQLTFASLNRLNYSTVDFVGTGLGGDLQNQIRFNTVPSTQDHGLIGAWATVGTEFAKYGSFGVTAMSGADYALNTAVSTWTFKQNIKQTASSTLTSSRNVNSLNLAQVGATTVDLGGNTLRIESGGLLVSGNFDSAITNGTLTAGTSANTTGELVVHQTAAASTLTIGASIGNNGTGEVAFTKSGAGAVVLAGSNTFTGGITVNAGTLRLGNAQAVAVGNRLAIEGGTLDLNGYNVTAGALSSASPQATLGVITNTAVTQALLTVGSGDASSSYYGTIINGTGGIALTKVGLGTVTLAGNNTFTGAVNVDAGKLVVGHANALGTTAGGTVVKDGATLEFTAEGTYTEAITLTGEGYNRQGALSLANVTSLRGGADQVRVNNVILAGNTTINTSTKRLDFDGTLSAAGFALTKIGSSQVTYEGGGTTNLGDLYVKQGDFTFGGGANALGNASNTIYINSNATLRFYNVAAVSKGITLRGGNWIRDGSSNATTFRVAGGGLRIEAGASALTHTATSQVIHLDVINRAVGATLNITNTSSPVVAFTTSTLNTNGIIGGYATWGGNTWAVSGASGTDITISGLSSFQTNSFTVAANNVDITSSQGPAANFTINSLRFNTAAGVTLTLQGSNVISSGGILVTSTVAGNATRITGGTLMGSVSGDLIIHQNNAGADFFIESIIADNTGATALTKSGAGKMVLSGSNTYSGGTYINGSSGGATRGILSVAKISDTGDSNIGQSTAGSNGLSFNNGILEYTGSAGAQTSRNVRLYSGGGEFRIGTAGVELELSGVISSGDTETNDGYYNAEAGLTKSGNGILALSGTVANTYTGDTVINAGVLLLRKSAGVDAIAGSIVVNNTGILRLGQTNQINNSSVLTLVQTGMFDLDGYSEAVGGLSGVDATSSVRNGGSSASVLGVSVAAGQTYKYAGKIEDGVSPLSIEKSGAGTQVLSGLLTYSGSTSVSAGTLQFGDGGATSVVLGGAVQIATGATLAVNSSGDVVLGDVGGAGSLVQAGSGTTEVSTRYALTGESKVTAGRLLVDGYSSGTVAGRISVTGGQLGGKGTINSNVVVSERGVINAGSRLSEIDRLTFAGDLMVKRGGLSAEPRLLFQVSSFEMLYNDSIIQTLSESAIATYLAGLDFSDIDGSGTSLRELGLGAHDQLDIKGTLTLEAGGLIVVDGGTRTFVAGDMLDLMDWATLANPLTTDGQWDVNLDLILPTLGTGLKWDRSLFLSDGVVVVVVPEPSKACLLLLGLGCLFLRRRRR